MWVLCNRWHVAANAAFAQRRTRHTFWHCIVLKPQNIPSCKELFWCDKASNVFHLMMFEAETEIPKQCYILVSNDICREVAGMIHMPCTFPLLPASVCMMVGWGISVFVFLMFFLCVCICFCNCIWVCILSSDDSYAWYFSTIARQRLYDGWMGGRHSQ